MTTTINQLSQRTDQICDAVMSARNHISTDVIVNGYGILADPFHIQSELKAAATSIATALDLLRAVRWPSDSDYDQIERDHNRSERA